MVPETNIYARSLAWRLFRDAADEDYLTARWASRAGLSNQFSWSAQQTIEKYLKCILLMNGKNVSKFGHDLMPMLAEVMEIAGLLIPSLLVPPPRFLPMSGFPISHFEPTRQFARRINDNGDANQRYRYNGVTVYATDLHKLDEFCFRLRRITFPLDMDFAPTDKSYRAILLSNPNFQPHTTLQPLSNPKRDGYLEKLETARWRNFSYYPQDAYEARTIQSGMYSESSEIFLNLERGEQSVEALEWLLINVKFGKSDKAYLRKCIDEK